MNRMWMMMVLVLGLSPAAGMAADWPQFLGPGRDGVVTGQKLPDKFPPGGPREVWSVPVGIGFGGASVAEGRVYLLDREDDQRDVLRCLALTDGREIWRHAYEMPGKLSYPGSRSTPTVGQKHIFTVGGFGNVHAFDRQTGRPVWGFTFKERFGSEPPNWGFSQSPLIYKDWVILAPMSSTVGLVAVRKDTGEVGWQSEPVGGNTYASPRLYTLGGVEQVVFITTDRVVSIDPTDGKKLWQFDGYQNRIPIPSPTQIDDKRLFITGGYGSGSVMVSVEQSGETWNIRELWRTTLGTQIHAPVFHENHIYLNANENDNLKGGGRNAPGMVCFDLDGNVRWQSDNQPGIDRGGFIVVDGRAYLLNGQSGQIHLIQLTPEGYREVDTAKVFETGRNNQNIWGPMALSDGYLVVRDQLTIKCLDLRPSRQASAR